MMTIKELHQKAMDLAERAVILKNNGNIEKAEKFFRESFKNEAEAAGLVPATPSSEPTRSILYRSAAALALDCGELREAEKLAAAGLAGDPPPGIADELRKILEKTNFHRHLELKKIGLKSDELQISLSGDAVGFGITPLKDFIDRINKFKKMVYRTIERQKEIPYNERPDKRQPGYYPIFMSVPRSGSFAVSLKIGKPHSQLLLPTEKILDNSSIIDEIFSCMALFNSVEKEELQKRIPDPAYFNNFIALAKDIAPDGRNISMVGFTTFCNGKEESVNLTTPRNRLERAFRDKTTSPKSVTEQIITGRLRFADAVGKKETIKILDELTGKSHELIVPKGMMDDIVKPLWNEVVTAVVYSDGKNTILRDIRESEDI